MGLRRPSATAGDGASPEMVFMSIPEIVEFIRSSFQQTDFDKAKRMLIAREGFLKSEIERKFSAELASNNVEKIELQTRIDGLVGELGLLRIRCSDLEQEVKKGEEEFAVKNEELRLKSEKISLLEKMVVKLEDRKVDMEAEMDQYKKDFFNIEHKFDCLKEELRVVRKKQHGDSGSELCKGLVDDASFWRRKCEALESEILQKKGQVAHLEAAASKVDDWKVFLEEEVGKYESKCDNLEREITRLKEEYSLSSEKEEKANERIASLLIDGDFWKRKCEVLSSQVSDLEKENVTLSEMAGKVEKGKGEVFIASKVEFMRTDDLHSENDNHYGVKREVVEIADSDDETDGNFCDQKKENLARGPLNLTKEAAAAELTRVMRFGNCGWISDVEVDCDKHKESLVPTPMLKRKRAQRVVSSDSETEGEEDEDCVPLAKLMFRQLEEMAEENKKRFATSESITKTPSRKHLVPSREMPKSLPDCITPESTPRAESASSSLRKTIRRKLVYSDTEELKENVITENRVVQEYYESESEGESLGGFIVNTSDSSQISSSSECSSGCSASEEVESDFALSDVVTDLCQEKPSKKWEYEADMLSSFAKEPQLCMQAVCALYRQQTSEEKSSKASIVHNKRGFNKFDAVRGSKIAEFLMDGDPHGPLKKSIEELQKYDQLGIDHCQMLANRYSKQLFTIYRNNEDPFFRQS